MSMCCAFTCRWTKRGADGSKETYVAVSPSMVSFRSLRDRVSQPNDSNEIWTPDLSSLTEVENGPDINRQARIGVQVLLGRTRA
jgi:hypothetical protein